MVTVANGELRLELNTADRNGKGFTGGEISSYDAHGYGRYEVTMKASPEVGVNSSFFMYTGPSQGTIWNEIDFEFLGNDRSKVNVAYHNNGQSYSKMVDLGFDHSTGFHEYAFEYEPGQIRWYADDKLIHTVISPDVPMPTIAGKMFMSIWTGMPQWMGNPTFSGETEAVYRDIGYQPFTPGYNYDGTPRVAIPAADGVLGKDAVGVYLVNTDTGLTIGQVTDEKTFTVASHDLDNIALVARGAGEHAGTLHIDSVKLDLTGAQTLSVVDNDGPYSLFGQTWQGPKPGLGAGNFSITSSAFSKDDATGALLSRSQLDFTVKGATGDAPPQTELLLYDAKTDKYIAHLTDGLVLNTSQIGSGNLAIVARAAGSTAKMVESITMDLQGQVSAKVTESVPPYALFGDVGGDYAGRLFPTGEYRIVSTSWTGDRATGSRIDVQDIDFKIVSSTATPAPSPFVLQLINADTDRVVTTVTDGARIDLDALGVKNATFVARATSNSPASRAESFVFDLDGTMDFTKTENSGPYALFGEVSSTNYNGRAFADGHYNLEIDAFSQDRGLGTLLASHDYDFFLV